MEPPVPVHRDLILEGKPSRKQLGYKMFTAWVGHKGSSGLDPEEVIRTTLSFTGNEAKAVGSEVIEAKPLGGRPRTRTGDFRKLLQRFA